MTDDRLRCAAAALSGIPDDYRSVEPADVVADQAGHSLHRGMHIGWVWGENPNGRFLDFLSEHRMAGMRAERVFANGERETIETPAEMRLVAEDPVEDAELERQFHERNRAAYAALRERGLLPPLGFNAASQDVNEYLRSGGESGAAE
jgi:hypothetical protein